MKKTLIILGIVIVVFGLIFGSIVWGSYNGLVSKQNAVAKAWADVETHYQRRLDTIPKFADTANFSADFQIKLATEYAKAREGMEKAMAKDTGKPEALQAAAAEGFNGLMVAVRAEASVEAKTDQLTELNVEIENIERVISHVRTGFNEAGRINNNAVRQVPNVAFISWFGWDFPVVDLFKAEKGAEKSPELDLKLN